MKRVLMIAYYFPPSGGSGVQRPLKFVKYLPRNGWQPVVLTVPENSAFPARDEKLAADIPEGTEIYRVRILEPHTLYSRLTGRSSGSATDVETVARWDRLPLQARIMSRIRATFFVPDARIGWYPFAVRAALKIHRANPFDVVFSTGPPFTNHLIGRAVARKIGRPWVADYRDPWTRAVFYPNRPGLVRAWDRRLEGRCLRDASMNIVVSPAMIDEFIKDHSGLNESDFALIPNGFDPDDFAGIEPPKERALTIVHSGSLFANRRPDLFFDAVRDLLAGDPRCREDLRLVFIGRLDAETRSILQSPPISSIVQDEGYCSHAEAVRWLRRGQILLLPVGAGPEVRGLATGKIFEYLAAGPPILTIGTPGEAARITEETGTGWVLNPQDKRGMKALLQNALKTHREGRMLQTDRREDAIENYSRAALTKRLAQLLESVTSGRHD
ncbi:MAG: glycosyltransferase family 4 protein [Candidatus Eisenbacteria bacterium]|uniref:Glycosyltransferase family 4 protein n=1 Tax=Eiseniibacteriota bacterium TaxID=2212470 RepID=A0A948W5W4_UNCEI|nr:glycosyltransferase family 4 protein [Candidatus Eisenbacteria bacterium]MBU2690460.1 glycosyltransferase family 4 protein [Candidatus Eisenbacteria bacterium]